MKVYWSSSFKRGYKKIIKRFPDLSAPVKSTIQNLIDDPANPKLRTHKLKGELEGSWACSIDYNFRIVFTFVKNTTSQETEILLIDIGTHEEIY